MKILMISDVEERYLWDDWNESTKERLSDISLILSAGDLRPEYLEFLVTMLNVPLVYVRGNHDGRYDYEPPEGCIDADGRIVEVKCPVNEIGNGRSVLIRILGLGGSMRYKDGSPDMYTEEEMVRRIASLRRVFLRQRIADRLRGSVMRNDNSAFDILLTHAPCRGFGDLDDLPHRGFGCFNDLLSEHRPLIHCYGHVHKEYGSFARSMLHPSGTQLINASGYYIFEL